MAAGSEEYQTVKLISADNFEFIIDRKCALASGTIKNMLSSPGIRILIQVNSQSQYKMKFISEISSN
jgi:hypothetical protein